MFIDNKILHLFSEKKKKKKTVRLKPNKQYTIFYLIKHPGHGLNFQTLGVGTFSNWALIQGWLLINCSPFSANTKSI